MATAWQKVICDSAMVFIDDEREKEKMAVNPAQFLRRMSLYMGVAIPMLNRPPELLTYLQKDLVKPEYGDFEWVSTRESTTQETVLETGMTDFDLVSCVVRIIDGTDVTEAPYEVTYDAATGNVTFPQQTAEGIAYVMDFYKDGEFAVDLTDRQIRLLGLAIACVWDDRFSNNWLNNTPKLHDDSFEVPNEANYMNATTKKRDANRMQFNGELKKYEQDVYYQRQIPASRRSRMFDYL